MICDMNEGMLKAQLNYTDSKQSKINIVDNYDSSSDLGNFDTRMEKIRNKKGFLCDMDGVIYHGSQLLPGVKEFIAWCNKEGKKYLFLTNNSAPSPKELQQKMRRLGVELSDDAFYTSALSTASFLSKQKPGGSCFVIGEAGLYNALYNVGFTMNDVNPDYVIVGESTSHNFEKISKAVDLVFKGAKLIGTNPDTTGPAEGGRIIPATGSFVASIELATGRKAYFLGKPNPLMMRDAMKKLGVKRSEACIIGDNINTDIIAGIESELDPVLVLSGVTQREDLVKYPYSPFVILNGIGDIVPKAPKKE